MIIKIPTNILIMDGNKDVNPKVIWDSLISLKPPTKSITFLLLNKSKILKSKESLAAFELILSLLNPFLERMCLLLK